MNYQEVYYNIIHKSKSKTREKLKRNQEAYIYYENHHILPKCLGGTNDKENLVLLTAREHYLCHKLLTYIYPNSRGLALAFFRMVFNKNGKHEISSKDFAYAKEILYKNPMSEETKEKIRKSMTGVKHPQWRNEHKTTYQTGTKHKEYSEEGKLNCSNGQKKLYKNGYINPNKGKKLSNEAIDKMSTSFTRTVLQFDKNDNFIKEWNSMRELKSNGFISSNIWECANGKRKTHKKCIWRYK